MDLIWGDIRKFITDDMLDQYDKIGFQGHSTLYRNTPEVNARYRTILEGELTYQNIFQSSYGHCFDEDLINKIYQDFLWSLWTKVKEASGDDFGNYGIERYNRAKENLNLLAEKLEG